MSNGKERTTDRRSARAGLTYRQQDPAEQHQQVLGVHPNPTRTYASVSYALPEDLHASFLTIRDLTGRNMHQERITSHQGQVLLDTRKLSSGTYLVVIEADGRMIATERLVVQK